MVSSILPPLAASLLLLLLMTAPASAQRDGELNRRAGPWTPAIDENRRPLIVFGPNIRAHGTLVDDLRRRFIEGEEPQFLTRPQMQRFPSDPQGGYGR